MTVFRAVVFDVVMFVSCLLAATVFRATECVVIVLLLMFVL